MKRKAKKSPHNKTYPIFLGLQFISKNKYYKRKVVIETVSKAVKLAQAKLRESFPGVMLKLEHQLTKLGKPVNAQIVKMVRRTSCGVFEVSEKNPNVYFEMGLSYSKKNAAPLILLNRKAAKKDVVASDVKDLFRLHYPQDKLSSKTEEIANHIRGQVAKQIHVNRYDIRRIWSGGVSWDEIIVVCPTLPTAYIPKHALRSSSEFVNLAKYGDPDALVELLILLRTFYPNIKITRCTSKKVSETQYRNDLIIIGGPDFNKVTKIFMKESKCPIQYKIEENVTAFLDKINKRSYPLKERCQKQEIQDYGLFARFPNPHDKSKTIIMIGGLGTHGVLCAAEAFGANPIGRKNTKFVIDSVSENPYFAVVIPVNISGTQVPPLCNIEQSTLHKYPWT